MNGWLAGGYFARQPLVRRLGREGGQGGEGAAGQLLPLPEALAAAGRELEAEAGQEGGQGGGSSVKRGRVGLE